MNKIIMTVLLITFSLPTPAATQKSISQPDFPMIDETNTKASDYPQFSIVGAWQYQTPVTGCIEEYQFQADGTLRATSAKQVLDSTYNVSEKHSQYAFYELNHQVVTSNNEKDCDGQTTEIGLTATNYVRYDMSGDYMVMCRDEGVLLSDCFGPLKRIIKTD